MIYSYDGHIRHSTISVERRIDPARWRIERGVNGLKVLPGVRHFDWVFYVMRSMGIRLDSSFYEQGFTRDDNSAFTYDE